MISETQSLLHLFGTARDQGSRPTCLPFAASDHHAALRDGWVPLSPEYICSRAGDAATGVTVGLSLEQALGVLDVDGQPVEQDYPYQPNGSTTMTRVVPTEKCHQCDGNETSPSVDDIVQPIENGQPVLVIMSISDAFYRPDKNHYITSTEAVDNSRVHAVVAVSTGEARGRRCIQVRNSWGLLWGHNGYAWVDADYLLPRLFKTAILQPREQNGLRVA